MSGRRYNLGETISAERAKNPGVEIEVGDKVIEIDAPSLWPDDVFVLAQKEDLVGATKALLGDDYEPFVAAGGSAVLLFQMIREAQRATLPESKASTD